jgi:hypothetical protein
MTGRTTKGFDDFRWERKRSQSKRPQPNALGYAANEALKELEQVEAKEVLDQQLTREVHDFFAAATRQAAGIVERVARDAEAEAGQRVEQEMEAFLFDALSRMNAFVVAVLQHKRGPVAETDLEPRIANIVGAALDRFRNEGTAELYDKHIGQDPFKHGGRRGAARVPRRGDDAREQGAGARPDRGAQGGGVAARGRAGRAAAGRRAAGTRAAAIPVVPRQRPQRSRQ